ncbi:hypothetical protein H6768_01580 [Candidatus Peribacteria bacterium]|nr:hypothetical protein [Candidatus Peribacteria bacterium]
MTGKKLVIFAGSQDIQDAAISESLYSELGDFLSKNRDRITEVLFGGGKYGVMGKVFEVSKKV